MKLVKILFFISIISLTSCVPKKKIIYLQGKQDASITDVNYEPKIQNDDLLSIKILSIQPELSESFNVSTNNNLQGYLVDQYGEIEFPVIGKIKIAGLTKTELKQFFKEKLSLYLSNPIIDIKILNYKISILGEVSKPGTYTFTTDRVTLLDAIATSGDLTQFGKRDNILIVRDYQGTKTFNRVDVTQASFLNSPFYYLDQNDVIYVEPRKAKIDSSGIIGSNVTTIISLVGALLTTTIILTRL